MVQIETTRKNLERIYRGFGDKHRLARKRLGRPLPLTEKILLSHVRDLKTQELERGKSYLSLTPDRAAMQDATAQMVLLQFAQAGLKAAIPATVHCDHLIAASLGSKGDLATAKTENSEVYDFLKTVCQKYGIGFWKPGSGIIHQVILENYAFPGGLMIGSDSHTPNAGGLGMMAIGVGGADVVDVLAGMPWELRYPKIIGVRLTGKLEGWTAPKDIILKVLEILSTKGGTNHIVEYFGPGAETISATGKGTISNMGAELGATTSLFSYDEKMAAYLKSSGRNDIAELGHNYAEVLRPDPEVAGAPEKFYDQVIEIDLSILEPYVVGPHSPDKARPISKLAKEAAKEGYPITISTALIGSCTNSSYEDMGRSAHLVNQAISKGMRAKVPFMVTPGSDRVFETIRRDGQLEILEKGGATVLANACGPCIGQWRRSDIKAHEANSIVSSYNRNFAGRNDGFAETLSFLASPELVTAMAFSGKLSFNPLRDSLDLPDGTKFKFEPPTAPELPSRGLATAGGGYIAPEANGRDVTVVIPPGSTRLQRLEPFEPWNRKDYKMCPVLLKAKGKCTTDHISPGGKWLRFRGHLDKISDNMFLGVINAFSSQPGKGKNIITGQEDQSLNEIARNYKKEGLRWVAVGDENFGEGSSREHAAMSPRFLGAAAVLTRSFARIHETNLKKQGVLPLTFLDPTDYDKIGVNDRISITNLKELKPGQILRLILHHPDGFADTILTRHSLSREQIGWFRAGSALNLLVGKAKKKKARGKKTKAKSTTRKKKVLKKKKAAKRKKPKAKLGARKAKSSKKVKPAKKKLSSKKIKAGSKKKATVKKKKLISKKTKNSTRKVGSRARKKSK